MALFLDVDGTLLDLASRPDEVVVDRQLRDDLLRMHRQLHGAVALLSGRPLSQLDALFDWRGRAAAGLHGTELRTPDGCVHATGDPTGFAAVLALAVEMVRAYPSVVLEDKRSALALHYRHTPSAQTAAEHLARSLLALAGRGYALQHGDHVIEVKPAGADKGRALGFLMGGAPFRGRRPWVLGDDLTDEDAFRHVNASDGISVIVGARRPTAACSALANPAAVRAWLHALARPVGRR